MEEPRSNVPSDPPMDASDVPGVDQEDLRLVVLPPWVAGVIGLLLVLLAAAAVWTGV